MHGVLADLAITSEDSWSITRLSTEDFRSVSAQLLSVSVPSVRVSKLLELVSDVSKDVEFSKAFCSQLIALATFRRVSKKGVDEVVDLLISSIERSELSELSDDVQAWFKTVKDVLVELLSNDVIRLPAKALHLSTDFDSLYSAAYVITAVRPVFDGDRETVLGAIVSQTLKIKFVDARANNGEGQISLALDIDDIEKLIAELEKAKRKATSAKASFSKNADVDVFVVGEETYGFG